MKCPICGAEMDFICLEYTETRFAHYMHSTINTNYGWYLCPRCIEFHRIPVISIAKTIDSTNMGDC